MQKKSYVEIDNIPTFVETWGGWIEDECCVDNQDIVIMIPGNPGVTGFYKMFLEYLYDKLQSPVWIVGHAGHQQAESNELESVLSWTKNQELYTLQGQLDHKVKFFRKYVPPNARVHLIGHSIGAYICLNMLKHSDINSKVINSYLLFPTIEKMADTPSGRFYVKFMKPMFPIIYILTWIFACLPSILQWILLRLYCVVYFLPYDLIPPAIEVLKPMVFFRVFYNGIHVIETVTDLDPELILNAKGKLKFYYAASDDWTPASYYENLKQKFPDIEIKVCLTNINHAFVKYSSLDVANLVAEWIQENTF